MIPNSLKLGVGFAIAIALLGMMFYLVGAMVSTDPTYSSSSPNNGASLVLTGDDVTEYDQSDKPPLVNPTRRIIQGTEVDGGCIFTSYYEPPRGQRYTMGRTLAVNRKTCEKLEEIGALSEADGEEAFEGEDEATDVTGETSSGSSALPQSDINTVYVAKLKTGWEDPFNIDVNWVQTGIEWRIISDEVLYRYHRCLKWKLNTSGWEYDGGTCTWRYRNNHTRVETNQTQHFKNQVFPCPDGIGANTIRQIVL